MNLVLTYLEWGVVNAHTLPYQSDAHGWHFSELLTDFVLTMSSLTMTIYVLHLDSVFSELAGVISSSITNSIKQRRFWQQRDEQLQTKTSWKQVISTENVNNKAFLTYRSCWGGSKNWENVPAAHKFHRHDRSPPSLSSSACLSVCLSVPTVPVSPHHTIG